MSSRELQELAELDRRISASSSGMARQASSSASRSPYRYDLGLSSSSTSFMPGRSVPYGLYNKPPTGPNFSRSFAGSAPGSRFGSSMRLSQLDQPGRNLKFGNLNRSMSSLNKSFIKKCVNTTDSVTGDPGSSLVPVSLNYVSHTLKIILKHEEDDPSQNLLHLLDDIEASILQLSMEALSIRAKHDLLYSMQGKDKDKVIATTIVALPVSSTSTWGLTAPSPSKPSSSFLQTTVVPAKPTSPAIATTLVPNLWTKKPDTFPIIGSPKEKESPQKFNSDDLDSSFSRKRGRTEDADTEMKSIFRNPNAMPTFGTPLSVGIGTHSAPTKLLFGTPPAPAVTSSSSSSSSSASVPVMSPTATALGKATSDTKLPAQPAFSLFNKDAPPFTGGKTFGGAFPTTTATTESNNNLIKLPSTTSFPNVKPTVPSTPYFMPPPISSSTPITSNVEPPKFSFGNSPFGSGLFGNQAPPPVNHVTTKEDNEEDEEDSAPPVNEFKPVEESDVIYETRVKIFEKADKDFKDLGLGKLYVKDHPKGHHLFVRAENNLGTLLVNMILTDKIPLNKKTNNVVTVDPQGNKGQGTTYLIRVKNEEAATALKDKLEELKLKKRVNNNNNSTTTS